MAKRDDESRRGSRGKRPSGNLPPQPASRMEMMLAAAAASAAEPPAVTHYQTYPPPPSLPPAYHSHAYPPAQPQPPAVGADVALKRKRAKKSEDEWTSTPTVASSMSISSLVAPPPPPAFAMPVASSATSLSSILSAASPIPSAPSPTVSVFQAPPAPIQSFAETERQRRSAANGVSGSSSTANAVATGASKSSSSGSSNRKGDSRGSSNNSNTTQLSMLDLFFPDTVVPPTVSKSSAPAAADTNGASKSLKRKRRGDSTAVAATSSSGNSGVAASVEFDMLRFGVDSTKLIPQGIVDRVDIKMDRALLTRLVESHVANWIKRAGFSATFIADATTLLTAYYPCHYPTLLDDVLACFLFKRPEFIDVLFKPMIEKLQKLGESATGSKYPVIDALARTCVPAVPPTDRARHDFSCATLLQTLLERNTDKFVLSPAITVCALHCSDAVLETLWRQLLRAWLAEAADRAAADDSSSGATQASPRKGSKMTTRESDPGPPWRIVDPEQQAFELLDEEKKLRARGDLPLLVGSLVTTPPSLLGHAAASSRCRLARALVRLVLLDSDTLGDAWSTTAAGDRVAVAAVTMASPQQQLLVSPLVQHAVALVLGHGSAADSAALLRDRVSRRPSGEEQFAQLLSVLVTSTATTRSVPTNNWFSRHVLRFLLVSDGIGGGDQQGDNAGEVKVKGEQGDSDSDKVKGDEAHQGDALRKQLLALVVARYLPLILGAPDQDSDDHGNEQGDVKVEKKEHKRDVQQTDSTVAVTSYPVSWDALASAEKLSASDMVERLHQLLELLNSVPPRRAAAFFDVWASAWASAPIRPVVVPWAYVCALVRVAIDGSTHAWPRAVAAPFESLVAQTCHAQFQYVRGGAAAASRFSDLVPLLLAASPSAVAQTLLHEAVDAMRTLEGGAAMFRNAVLVSLSDAPRADAWAVASAVAASASSASPTKRANAAKSASSSGLGSSASDVQAAPRSEVELQVLASLRLVASLDDAAGQFVRAQLSSRPVVRLLTALLCDIARHRLAMAQLLALLEAVIGVSRRQRGDGYGAEDSSSSSEIGAEWLRQHIVQQIVASAYSADAPPTADRLAALLQTLAQRSSSGGGRATLLWATLRECTRLCCGCGCHVASPLHATTVEPLESRQRQRAPAVAATFAELIKVLLSTSVASKSSNPSNALLVSRVAEFAQQELASCRETRLNRFLLLLLPKLAGVARPAAPPRACLAAAQLAVFSLGATARDEIRLLQLQLLKALCSRLRDDSGERARRCEELVCSERLQADLRRIVNAEGVGASSSRACVVLAQGVLQFAAALHRSKQQQQRTLAIR